MPEDPVIDAYCDFAVQSGLAAATTVYCRRKSLQRLARWLPVPVAEATPAMLAAWRASLGHLSDQSVLNYVTDARRLYAWLADERAIAQNPALRIPVPRRRRRLPRPISTADLCAAIVSAPDPVRLMLVLAAFAGLRACEITYLRRECVLDTLRQPMILIAADATKGGHEHMVPIAPYAAAQLARSALPRSGWIFSRLDGKPGPNRPHEISRRANRWLRECGIAATLHQLRHWFGTEAYAVDQDLIAVADMMGHRNLDSTRIYSLVTQARGASIVAALPVPPELLEAA